MSQQNDSDGSRGHDSGDRAQLAQARLAAIVTDSEDAIISKSLDGTITTWNAAAERLFGWPAAEIIGKSILTVIPPELHDQEPLIVARISRGDRIAHFETVRMKRDGTRFPVSLSISPLRDADGTVVGASKILRDITARKQAEAAIARNEALFRNTFEQAAVGMAHVSLDGRWLRFNDRLAELVGYTRDEMLARRARDMVHPSDAPVHLEQIRALLAGELPHYSMDELFVRRGGIPVWVRVTVSLGRNASGEPEYFIVVVEDAQERHMAADALRDAHDELEAHAAQLEEQAIELEMRNDELMAAAAQLEESLEDADRLRREAELANEAKGQFLATMSHELRTPLNAIAGHIALVVDGVHGPLTDAQRDALERAQRAQRHLLGLVNDVLNFARLEHGRVEYAAHDVALGELVGDVVRMVEPQFAARTIALRNDVPATVPATVCADAEKVRQVLLNLLANAVKFTQPDGRVIVALANDGRVVDDRVTLLVHDTGIGIAPEQLQAIFEPFVQLNRTLATPADGTGLGLAISRDLARGMAGDLIVQSTPGSGSTFALSLPARLGH